MAYDVQQVLSLTPDEALTFLIRCLQDYRGDRLMVGLAGGPGTGKSTLAQQLVEALNTVGPDRAANVPMDGFHMLHAKLERLGTVKDKGGPHTFEAEAFGDFLRTLKTATTPVSGPGYSREIEDVVPDAFIVAPETRMLVVEGNYLLLPDPRWADIKDLFDLTVFIDVPRDKVRARLLKRHAEHGLFTEERNREHVDRVDLKNYDLVQGSRPRADIVIDLVTDL